MPKFSVKKPMTVMVGVVLIIILGVVAFTKTQTDLLPSLDLPYAMVMTTYVGASPEEVEKTVTKPVEQAMASISNIKSVSSVSNENYSMVIMEFSDDVNMDTTTIDIRESLDLIQSNWKNDRIGAPMILKLNPDMLPVMVAAIDVEGMTNTEISRYVEDTLLNRLESVEGVASVSVSGMVEEKVNVVLNQDKIDKVNAKLAKSVEKKLEDAEKEMAEAKNKIDDGKEELSSGREELEGKKTELTQGMQEADKQLEEARLELLKKELELEEGLKELKKQEQDLLAKQSEVLAAEKEMETNEALLLEKEAEADKGKKQIEDGKAQAALAQKELDSKREEAEAGIAQVESNKDLDEAAKAAMLKELQDGMVKIESAQAFLTEQTKLLAEKEEVLKTGLAELKTARKTLDAGKKELASGKKELETGLKTVQGYISQMEGSKPAIDQGKEQIYNQKEELAKQKALAEAGLTDAELKLSDAEKELLNGEKTLNEKTDNFGDTRENALKEANLADKLTVDMISKILQAQNFSMPAGYVSEEENQYLVRVGDQLHTEKEIGNLIILDMGLEDMEPVKLSDVADVFMADNSSDVYAKVNGNDAVVMSFEKQNSYSTAEVTESVKKRLAEISGENAAIHTTYLMDQGMYIDLVVDSVLNNLIFGAVLAIIILIFFLKDIRPTFIVACSIPISVIFAMALMYFSGITLNIISLSGLAVGVGMLVDNSIVVIENIYRLRQKGVSVIKASVTGAVQVSGAIVASTLTTVCVFLPIVFVEGITRQLFTDMALTIGYSLVASLIIALTVVPAMSSGMLRKTREKKHPIMDFMLRGYEKAIRWSLRFKPVILILALAILAGSMYLSLSKGTSFMPQMDSTQISVSLKMPEKATDKEKMSLTDEAMARIMKIEDIEAVGAMSGGNMMGGMMGGGGSGGEISMYVLLKEEKTASSQEVADEINRLCEGMDCIVTAKGSNMDMSALGGSGISIQVRGNEIPQLQKIASEVAGILKGVEGVNEVSDGMQNPSAEMKIVVDKAKAIANGLTVAQIYAELSAKLSEAGTATTLNYESVNYPVIVFGQEAELTRDSIADYPFQVKDSDGTEKTVYLKDMAQISSGVGLSSIRRSENERYINVSASIKDNYNIGLVSAAADKALLDYKLPAGYKLVSQGENETINDSLKDLVAMLLLAIAFIYLIMVAQFQSLLSPFIVMFTIPLAFTGGFLGLWITGNEISVISMIGFVMIAGIIVNNGIVLVDYVNQLRRDGMEKKEALVEAGKTRMRPVLMTALTTILGLSTMAIGFGMGAEMVQPIAIVSIGGLLYGTLMTVFVVPVIYDLFNRKKIRVVSEEELKVYEEL